MFDLTKHYDRFVRDEDGVSPVIGVILMVAITVILAAVIASFVLNLGSNIGGSSPPQASMNFEYDGNAPGVVTVTMQTTQEGGIQANYLSVSGDLDTGCTWSDSNGLTSSNPEVTAEGYSGTSQLSAGDSFEVCVTDGEYQLDVIWNNGQTSTTLQSDSGPDA